MDISNAERVAKLIGNLTKNPDLVLPWVKTSLLSKKLPLFYPLPWWSFRAIDAAIPLVRGKTIFEYGTGGSTILFSRTAKRIRSVEDDAGWLEIVRQRLSVDQSSNVELIYRPFNFKAPEGFEQSAYLHEIGNEDWDIVIIDGQDWTFRERIVCFDLVEPRMKPGGTIIFDDFWRYREVLPRSRASRIEEFESVGPCRLGVTSTAFFHYE